MTEPNVNSLINIGELAKPANTLIEKIGDAIQGAFRPFQIQRVSKAEAEAAITKATAEMDVLELQQRTMSRLLAEEMRNQYNIENIAYKALPLIKEDASPEYMDDDWIVNFFDKSRLISDEDMQNIWSRILAGEANNPGTFSRNTINILETLDKYDAEIFTTLCRFCWYIENNIRCIVSSSEEAIYNDLGINFDALQHLEDLGLIKFSKAFSLLEDKLPQQMKAHYFGTQINMEIPEDKNHQIIIGEVLLSRSGRELSLVSNAKPVDGFIEYTVKYWEDWGLILNSIVD